jgi:hypothetical protein
MPAVQQRTRYSRDELLELRMVLAAAPRKHALRVPHGAEFLAVSSPELAASGGGVRSAPHRRNNGPAFRDGTGRGRGRGEGGRGGSQPASGETTPRASEEQQRRPPNAWRVEPAAHGAAEADSLTNSPTKSPATNTAAPPKPSTLWCYRFVGSSTESAAIAWSEVQSLVDSGVLDAAAVEVRRVTPAESAWVGFVDAGRGHDEAPAAADATKADSKAPAAKPIVEKRPTEPPKRVEPAPVVVEEAPRTLAPPVPTAAKVNAWATGKSFASVVAPQKAAESATAPLGSSFGKDPTLTDKGATPPPAAKDGPAKVPQPKASKDSTAAVASVGPVASGTGGAAAAAPPAKQAPLVPLAPAADTVAKTSADDKPIAAAAAGEAKGKATNPIPTGEVPATQAAKPKAKKTSVAATTEAAAPSALQTTPISAAAPVTDAQPDNPKEPPQATPKQQVKATTSAPVEKKAKAAGSLQPVAVSVLPAAEPEKPAAKQPVKEAEVAPAPKPAAPAKNAWGKVAAAPPPAVNFEEVLNEEPIAAVTPAPVQHWVTAATGGNPSAVAAALATKAPPAKVPQGKAAGGAVPPPKSKRPAEAGEQPQRKATAEHGAGLAKAESKSDEHQPKEKSRPQRQVTAEPQPVASPPTAEKEPKPVAKPPAKPQPRSAKQPESPAAPAAVPAPAASAENTAHVAESDRRQNNREKRVNVRRPEPNAAVPPVDGAGATVPPRDSPKKALAQGVEHAAAAPPHPEGASRRRKDAPAEDAAPPPPGQTAQPTPPVRVARRPARDDTAVPPPPATAQRQHADPAPTPLQHAEQPQPPAQESAADALDAATKRALKRQQWQDRVKEQKAARTAARRDRQHPEDDALPERNEVAAPAPEPAKPAPKIAVAKRPAERTNAPTAAPAQAAPEQPASAMGPAESGTDADAKKKKWASWKEKKQLLREQKASRIAAAASGEPTAPAAAQPAPMETHGPAKTEQSPTSRNAKQRSQPIDTHEATPATVHTEKVAKPSRRVRGQQAAVDSAATQHEATQHGAGAQDAQPGRRSFREQRQAAKQQQGQQQQQPPLSRSRSSSRSSSSRSSSSSLSTHTTPNCHRHRRTSSNLHVARNRLPRPSATLLRLPRRCRVPVAATIAGNPPRRWTHRRRCWHRRNTMSAEEVGRHVIKTHPRRSHNLTWLMPSRNRPRDDIPSRHRVTPVMRSLTWAPRRPAPRWSHAGRCELPHRPTRRQPPAAMRLPTARGRRGPKHDSSGGTRRTAPWRKALVTEASFGLASHT